MLAKRSNRPSAERIWGVKIKSVALPDVPTIAEFVPGYEAFRRAILTL